MSILVTGGAGFIGSNFSSGVTRWRALAFTESRATCGQLLEREIGS